MEALPPGATAVERLTALLSAMSDYCTEVCGAGALINKNGGQCGPS
jgi:hypothetical protein